MKGQKIMEFEDIKELALMMQEMELTVLDYSARGETIRLERGTVGGTVAMGSGVSTEHVVAPVSQPAVMTEVPQLHELKSPTVGTFYTSPEPGKEPYVAVGDRVRKGDVLCLLEAMKMLNEIASDKDGVIVEVCVSDKQVVEYGQPLFRIDTSAE